MAATINDLYLKYVNKVGRSLETDRYFQYLFEIVRAGSNVLHLQHHVLHKVVDERWLGTIEDSLESLNRIIEKPRRYVARKEEIVPVELAKRITADSVRHLSMNTQYIVSAPDSEEVHPTKILSVSNEDTYDLYENRFIYHLIQRLVTFIDKRTDVIFWSTGDETKDSMTLESKIDDAYEQIEYKLEMSIKNTQSFAENDGDNMQVFMRIDRVRRLVMALRDSSFCSLMAGCSIVRSPIQRTNLLTKDRDYRKCYQLWQFLESYDEIGYTIDVQDETMQFDEEYLLQAYTNLITNYTVFKSLLEGDERNVEKLSEKHRKPSKPKFIKKIEEEIVPNRDIEEVEIRRVFIEEVTQAQVEAEEKLAQETVRADEAQAEVERLDQEMQDTMMQFQTMMQQLADSEDRADVAEQERDTMSAQMGALQQGLEESEREAAETQAALEQAKAEAETAAAALAAAEAAKAEAESAAAEAQTQMQQAQEKKDAAEQARQTAEADAAAAREAAKNAESAKSAAESAAQAAQEQKAAAEQAAAEMQEKLTAAQDEAAQTAKARDEALAQAQTEAAALAETAQKYETVAAEKEAALSDAAAARQAQADAERLAAEKSDAADAAQRSEQNALTEKQAAQDAAAQAAQAKQEAEARADEANEAKSAAETARDEALREADAARKAAEDALAQAKQAQELLEAERAAHRETEAALEKAKRRIARRNAFLGVFGVKQKEEDE